jgi:hypothetical protein
MSTPTRKISEIATQADALTATDRVEITQAMSTTPVTRYATPGQITDFVETDISTLPNGLVTNAMVNASAGIVDTKLATISTAGKVSNSATTGTASATADTLVLRDGSGVTALSGLNMADGVISRPRFTDYAETRTAPTISAGTLTLNLENGNVFSVSLNANITTLTIQNPPASGNAGSFTLQFTADGTGRTVTWGASVKWPGGTAPTLTSTNAKRDTFVFFTVDAGTNWYAFVAGQNA